MKIKKWKHTIYNRFGLECVKDPVRNILIQNTPEEIVRQNVIKSLMDVYGYPVSTLETEYLIKSSRTRADIVVWMPTEEIDQSGKRIEKAYIVIECKSEEVALTEEHFQQGASYSNELDTEYLVITNGKVSWIYRYNDKDEVYEEIEDIPNYSNAMREEWVPKVLPEPEIKIRPSLEQLKDLDNLNKEFSDWIIGLDTPREYWAFVVDFQHLLWEQTMFFTKPITLFGYKFCEDLGVSLHAFGNASGGKYFGKYRSFLIKDRNGNNHIVRFIIIANMKSKNHPLYGNSRGKSMLNVAICNGEKMHNSLQLSIDDFVSIEESNYTFWHNGRMTVGNLGPIKNQETLNFVGENCPGLIRESKIYLGQVPKKDLLVWEDVRTVVFHLAIYSLLRDELRSEVVKNR